MSVKNVLELVRKKRPQLDYCAETKLMKGDDPLRSLLVEFFDLPAATPIEELAQQSLAVWDSLAMVQLIAELEHTFSLEFDVDEIHRLRSYQEIRDTLARNGILQKLPQV